MRLAGLLLALILLPFSAMAEKRVALVIGNGAYKAQNLLINPPSDALLISQALTKARFETIETKNNLGIAEFRQALRRFQSQANGAEVALVYFAGHGIEANGANWLIPTDAELSEDRDLDYEAIKADLVLQALQGAHMRVLVLDACRDNPFGRNWRASVRSTTSGLAKIEADDVLILFAAAPGRTASDGSSANSPFAEALAKRLPEPGLAIQLLGGNVRDDVLAATGGSQRPYVSASITGKPLFLVPAERPPAEAKQAPTPPSPQKLSEAAEAWTVVKDTTSIAALEAFLARFKDTYYADLARLRLEELKNKVAMATPPTPPQAVKDCDGIEITTGKSRWSLLPKEFYDIFTRCFKPGAGKSEQFEDCEKCPEMVVVPAGSFTMGSPASEPERTSMEDQLRVSIAKPFAVGRFAVTFDEWDACVVDGGCNGYKPADQGWGRGKRPVINVNWDDAKAYVSWLSRKTGKSYRLLSEGEREYVARAGTTTPFWWGSSITPKQANYNGSVDPYKGGGSKGEYRQRTMPVDSFEANPWGLYNVHGNVWDWTEDCWHDNYQGAPTDGSTWTTACSDSSRRVVRGGSWGFNPLGLRSACRARSPADSRTIYQGFRLARTLD